MYARQKFTVNKFNRIPEVAAVRILSFVALKELIYLCSLLPHRCTNRLQLCESAQDDSLWEVVWRRNVVSENGPLRAVFHKYVVGDVKVEDVECGFYEEFMNLIRIMNRHAAAIVSKRMEVKLSGEKRNMDLDLEYQGLHVYIGDQLRSVKLIPHNDIEKLKVAILGDKGSGKSQYVATTKGKKFGEVYDLENSHIREVEFKNIYSVRKVPVEITDTSCSDKNRSMILKGSDIIFVFFSVTDSSSFIHNVESTWLRECIRYAPEKPWILVGTKKDCRNRRTMAQYLLKDDFPVTQEEGIALAQKYGFTTYTEISNKRIHDIDDLLVLAVAAVFGEYEDLRKIAFKAGNNKKKKCHLM
jgi:GTPase SAR1 family protein